MLCASKCPRDHTQATCGDLVVCPLVALADVDRAVHRGVLAVFILVPLVRRALVLVLWRAGGVVDFPLHGARHLDALLFARRIWVARRWALPRGCW